MESRNSKILNNILEQRKDCIRRRKKEETNETNTLDEVVKSLKKREAELEKEFGERVQKLENAYQEKTKQLEEEYQKKARMLDEDYNQKVQNFEKEKEKVAELNKIESEVINLNIGGHKLTTSLQTLQSDPSSMLGVMFSGRHPIIKQDDGSIFIDRDGRHFHIILNYLRGTISSIEQLPDDRLTLSDLVSEVEYYQLQGLRKIIKLKKTERTTLSQSQLDEYFEFGERNRLETMSYISLKNLNLDKLDFENIRFKHSLDLSGSSLEDTSISDCEFFRGCQYSFDRTNLSNFNFSNNFCYSYGLERLIRSKQMTFYDAQNIDLASIYPESIRRAIKDMYNL